MRRLLSIAKFSPLALSLSLVVVWIVSVFWYAFAISSDDVQIKADYVAFFEGTIEIGIRSRSPHESPRFFHLFRTGKFPDGRQMLGYFAVYADTNDRAMEPNGYWVINLPILLLLTCLLPFAVGPMIRYRFPLWSWCAFLTLLSAEFAYYLYWRFRL